MFYMNIPFFIFSQMQTQTFSFIFALDIHIVTLYLGFEKLLFSKYEITLL